MCLRKVSLDSLLLTQSFFFLIVMLYIRSIDLFINVKGAVC